MLTNDNDENVLYSAQIGLKMKVHTYLFIEETFGCLFMQFYLKYTNALLELLPIAVGGGHLRDLSGPKYW